MADKEIYAHPKAAEQPGNYKAQAALDQILVSRAEYEGLKADLDSCRDSLNREVAASEATEPGKDSERIADWLGEHARHPYSAPPWSIVCGMLERKIREGEWREPLVINGVAAIPQPQPGERAERTKEAAIASDWASLLEMCDWIKIHHGASIGPQDVTDEGRKTIITALRFYAAAPSVPDPLAEAVGLLEEILIEPAEDGDGDILCTSRRERDWIDRRDAFLSKHRVEK